MTNNNPNSSTVFVAQQFNNNPIDNWYKTNKNVKKYRSWGS